MIIQQDLELYWITCGFSNKLININFYPEDIKLLKSELGALQSIDRITHKCDSSLSPESHFRAQGSMHSNVFTGKETKHTVWSAFLLSAKVYLQCLTLVCLNVANPFILGLHSILLEASLIHALHGTKPQQYFFHR